MQFSVFVVIGIVVASATGADFQQIPINISNDLIKDPYSSSDVAKGPSKKDDSNNIAVQGYLARPDMFPFHVELFIRNDVDRGTALASGSLITPNYVLTSANLLRSSIERANITYGYALLGTDNGLDQSRLQRINFTGSDVQLHPLYDIATMRLVHPVTFTEFVQLIRLPSLSDSRTHERKEGTNIGSGGLVRYVRNQILTNADCSQLHPHASIESHHICTNAYVGGAFCNQKHGSGLTVDDQGSPLLIGVISLFYPCTENYPTVFVRISEVRDWIADNSNYVFDL
ncbi:chymotrypsin-2-like [Anopheles maculipalpis]|uniref:chymotrypsin-2-like n=1 Tax=Anopheles maculipalpis TaxID=1496333 RepID=UPI002159471F|nr:chymotrypsin-2-like [Anopheles maculipalpis]